MIYIKLVLNSVKVGYFSLEFDTEVSYKLKQYPGI